MRLNHTIIISGLILMAGGAYRVLVMKDGGFLTKVIVGGYVLVLLASFLDLIGGPISTFVGYLMWLAVGTVALGILSDVVKKLTGAPVLAGNEDVNTRPGPR